MKVTIALSYMSALRAPLAFPGPSPSTSMLCYLCRVWSVLMDLDEIIGTISWQHLPSQPS